MPQLGYKTDLLFPSIAREDAPTLPTSHAALGPINPLQDTQWDTFVSSCSETTIFHSAAWARVLHDTYGFTPLYYKLGDGANLSALLPVMEVNSRFTGRRGVTLPFTDECQPIVSAPADFKNVLQHVLQYGASRRWKYFECRGGNGLVAETSPSISFYGHSLKLCRDENGLLAGFDSSVRRAIRKGQNAGVRAEVFRSVQAVRSFYWLHCKTRQKHGLPPQPFSFFLNIHRHVISKGFGFVTLATHGGAVVAAAIFFHTGNKAIYKFGASDAACQDLRGNNLVMWEAIKHCARSGFEWLDFGRTSVTNEGLRRFKLGWGATERTIEYLQYDFRKKMFVVGKDSASGWHNLIFRMMPPFLSRFSGALLYKHWG